MLNHFNLGSCPVFISNPRRMPIALKSASALLNKIALEHMINAPNVKEITAL